MQPGAHDVGQVAQGVQVAGVQERKAVVGGEAFAGFNFAGNGFKGRVQCKEV